MRTKASILGHPIHPMLVAIPLGALPTALVFDVLRVFWGAEPWAPAAFVAVLVGEVGILLAMIPGFVDYRANVPARGAVHAVARAHMGLGMGLAIYFGLVAWLHGAAITTTAAWATWTPLVAMLLGSVGLTVQGFLGGELRTRHQLGVETGGQDVARAHAPPPDADPTERKGPYSGGGVRGSP